MRNEIEELMKKIEKLSNEIGGLKNETKNSSKKFEILELVNYIIRLKTLIIKFNLITY